MRKLFFLAVLAFGMNATAQEQSVSVFASHKSIQGEYNLHFSSNFIYNLGGGYVFKNSGALGFIGLGYQFAEKLAFIGKIGMYPREDALGYYGISGYYKVKENLNGVLTVDNAGIVMVGVNFKL